METVSDRVNYYRRYMGDFQADTMALSMMEQGAYDRLLDYYYSTEKSIPLNSDRAAIICRAVTMEERAAVQMVLETFFERMDDGWHNKRADREIAAAQTARSNGSRGGRPEQITGTRTGTLTGIDTGTVAEDIPGMGGQKLTGTGHPPTTNHQPKTRTPLSASADTYSPEFLRFWKAWPANDRKTKKFSAGQSWRKQRLDGMTDEIITHVRTRATSKSWREGYYPLPVTYLNQRQWEDGADRPVRGEFEGVA